MSALDGVLTEAGDGVLLRIHVAPRAARERVGPIVGDRLKVAVRAPAEGGRANDAVVALVARELQLRRSDLALSQGAHARRKALRIRGVARAVIAERLAALLDDRGCS